MYYIYNYSLTISGALHDELKRFLHVVTESDFLYPLLPEIFITCRYTCQHQPAVGVGKMKIYLLCYYPALMHETFILMEHKEL